MEAVEFGWFMSGTAEPWPPLELDMPRATRRGGRPERQQHQAGQIVVLLLKKQGAPVLVPAQQGSTPWLENRGLRTASV